MRPSKPATDALGIGEISRCAEPRRGPGPAHVATRSALSIRKSASTLRLSQSGQRLLAIDAGDPHSLGARAFAGHDRDVALGDAKGFREEGNQLVVRGAVHGRRGEPDEEGAVAQAGESAAARPGPRNDSRSTQITQSVHVAVRVPRAIRKVSALLRCLPVSGFAAGRLSRHSSHRDLSASSACARVRPTIRTRFRRD